MGGLLTEPKQLWQEIGTYNPRLNTESLKLDLPKALQQKTRNRVTNFRCVAFWGSGFQGLRFSRVESVEA